MRPYARRAQRTAARPARRAPSWNRLASRLGAPAEMPQLLPRAAARFESPRNGRCRRCSRGAPRTLRRPAPPVHRARAMQWKALAPARLSLRRRRPAYTAGQASFNVVIGGHFGTFLSECYIFATDNVALCYALCSKRINHGDSKTGQTGTRLGYRAADHGIAGFARAALGHAHHLGAARHAADVSRVARALRRDVADVAEQSPARTARNRHRRSGGGGRLHPEPVREEACWRRWGHCWNGPTTGKTRWRRRACDPTRRGAKRRSPYPHTSVTLLQTYLYGN